MSIRAYDAYLRSRAESITPTVSEFVPGRFSSFGRFGECRLDLRTIAATLFGVAGSTCGQTIESAKDSNTTKKPAASVPGNDSEDRKDKTLSDPASILAMHPELTAPVMVPEAMVPVSSKQGDLEAEEAKDGECAGCCNFADRSGRADHKNAD